MFFPLTTLTSPKEGTPQGQLTSLTWILHTDQEFLAAIPYNSRIAPNQLLGNASFIWISLTTKDDCFFGNFYYNCPLTMASNPTVMFCT